MTESPDGSALSTETATRIFLRPMANPLSLGFLGLFVATLALTSTQLRWISPTQSHVLALGILVFTVPAQLISCVFGFLTRDLVAATGMGVQAGIWAVVGVSRLLSRPSSTSAGLGFLLAVGAAALAMPAAGALKGKVLAGAVMFTTVARWSVTSAYEIGGGTTVRMAAGAAGLLLAVMALYASLAFELEDQQRRVLLPTFRRGSGSAAVHDGLPTQVAAAANEAGVRKQL